MVELTNIVIAFFTAVVGVMAIFQAYFTRLSYKVYILMSRPVVFARPETKDGQPRIIVENSGKGVAWNGKAKVTALPSYQTAKYDSFKRLRPGEPYEHPTGDEAKISFDPEDKRLKISIDYEDEERGGKKYHWVEEFNLPDAWLL